jgi:hypothetical protein
VAAVVVEDIEELVALVVWAVTVVVAKSMEDLIEVVPVLV